MGLIPMPGYLRVEVGPGDASSVMQTYRSAAIECLEEGVPQRVLVVATGGDADVHDAVRSTVRMIALAGAPGYRFALVSGCAATADIYEQTAEAGKNLGLDIRHFLDQNEALAWLLG